MAAPTITLDPTSGPAGTVVTVTAVRDTPPTPVTVTATTPVGSASAAFSIVEALAVAAEGRTIDQVSDDGTTFVGTFTA